jgi:4-amino-4-deoxy-L-arabinose transferase-like glycosyltransferase
MGKYHKVILTIPIVLYLFFSLWDLKNPGLHNDEAFFVIPALMSNFDDEIFTFFKFHKFPLLLTPYIGALKAYIYYPVFKIFNVSVYSIRVPMIVFGTVTLFFIYQTVKIIYDNKVAFFCLFMTSINPSIITHLRMDYGHSGIEVFFKSLALYLFFLCIKNKKYFYLPLIALIISLGVFARLNFIWFSNAFIIAAFIFYRNDIIALLKGLSVRGLNIKSLFMLCSYSISYIYFFFIITRYDYLSKQVSLENFRTYFVKVLDILIQQVSGVGFYNWIIGDFKMSLYAGYFVLFMAVIFLGIFLCSYNRKKRVAEERREIDHRAVFFFLVLMVVNIMPMFLTKKTAKSWYAFEMHPFITIIFSVCAYYSYNYFYKSLSKKTLLVFSVIIIIAYNIGTNILYITSYSKPVKNIFWSSKIYDLINYTKKMNVKFVCVDWGIYSQLVAHDPKMGKYQQICGVTIDAKEEDID